VYDASEVLRHNDEAAGFWTVLDGRVYDLTGFERLHPGGHKIVRAYAGMDATAVYRAVGHATDPSVDALRGLYELGVVRRLDFGAAYGISIGARGLELTTVRALYQTWISTAHLVVEMQNAHANDRSIREGPVARGEDRTEVSPFKLALLREVHPRFVHHYVEPLCASLIALWAPTSGACSATQDVGWMARRLTAPDVAGDGTDALEVVEAIAARDAALLDEVKDILRQGLVLFERHEDRVLRDASGALLELARRLPDAVVGWRRDVAVPRAAVTRRAV
jgi:sulfite reductase (NADPH) flavoprotein alpha-component